jgi:HlyD family secretion protein
MKDQIVNTIKLFFTQLKEKYNQLHKAVVQSGILQKRWFQFLLVTLLLFFVYKVFFPKTKTYTGTDEVTKTGFFHKVRSWFGSKKNEEVDLDILSIKVIDVKKEAMIPQIASLGSIEFYEKIDVVPKTSGIIEKLYVKEGDVIKKDQVLLEMEKLQLLLEQKKNKAALDSAYSGLKLSEEKYYKAKMGMEIRAIEIEKRITQVKELKIELDKNRITFKGKQALYNAGGISKEEYEAAKIALVATEAKFRLSQNDLSISQVGFRDEDLKTRGYPVPEDPKERLKILVDLNTQIEKAEIEVARSQAKATQAALDSTNELLKTTTIRSPIDGVVAWRNKHVGEFVNQGGVTNSDQAILVLVSIEKVYAKINIKEAELKNISSGMKVDFSVDVYPNEVFSGKVSVINPIVDPKTHTTEIKALLDNPSAKLKPGMFIRALITKGELEMIVMVPMNAVLPKEGENAQMFIIKDNLAYKIDVETGRQFDNKIEITKGLEPGSVIALEKFSQLRDGLKIRPIFKTLSSIE